MRVKLIGQSKLPVRVGGQSVAVRFLARPKVVATITTNVNYSLCFVQIPLGFISRAGQFEETQINLMRLVLKVGRYCLS